LNNQLRLIAEAIMTARVDEATFIASNPKTLMVPFTALFTELVSFEVTLVKAFGLTHSPVFSSQNSSLLLLSLSFSSYASTLGTTILI